MNARAVRPLLAAVLILLPACAATPLPVYDAAAPASAQAQETPFAQEHAVHGPLPGEDVLAILDRPRDDAGMHAGHAGHDEHGSDGGHGGHAASKPKKKAAPGGRSGHQGMDHGGMNMDHGGMNMDPNMPMDHDMPMNHGGGGHEHH